MARTRRQRDYRAEYQRRLARGAASGKTRRQAAGHGPKGDLSEYEARVISENVRRWAREYYDKAAAAGASERADAKHEREQVRLWILQFQKSGFAKFKEAASARDEHTNTAEFFKSYYQVPYRGQSEREAAQDRFSEDMEDELGITLDPRLDWFLGGPSPKNQEKERERRRRYNERRARRNIERGAAGRGRRRVA